MTKKEAYENLEQQRARIIREEEDLQKAELLLIKKLLNAYRVFSAGTNLRMKIDLLAGMENTGYFEAATLIRADWNAEFITGLEDAKDK